MSLPRQTTVQYGDIVMIVGKDHKVFLRTVRQRDVIQTHYGQVDFDKMVGMPYGEQFRTHLGNPLYILAPNLEDVLIFLNRGTQIIYPKDLGYIILKLGLFQGAQVIESGTGSGALTSMLALMVGDEGKVYSYERRAGHLQQAKQNLERLGLDHRVNFIQRDIEQGFDQSGVHALFLDVPNPTDYLDQAWAALRGGGFFGALVPTANQLIELLYALQHGPWFFIQAEELIMRPWKTVPARARPDDNMYGHTGFLIFARAVSRETHYIVTETDDPEIRPPIE
ncbi:MAG: tRNA (adenine-N1)-methyltransferase [Anaerolineales bacterium]|nr:tRNA (adenine-N1)-methyltransferase [Anaerolineales bacterium]